MKKPNKNKITFFPGGDKTFIVGADDDKIKARVSTDVLKVASAAFGAMLTSGFKESLEKEVSLTEEDPAVMLDFFNVIHGETKHLEQRDGSHLVKLAVMADMWLCVDALKEWVAKQMEPVAQNLSRDIEFGIILPTPATSGGRKEQSLWEVDKTAKGTYTYTIRSKVLNLVFDIKDIIEIAYVFELDDLLWDASRFALVYSSGPGEFEIPCRVPFPPIGESGDISVHDVLAKLSRRHASDFVTEVWECIDRNTDVVPFRRIIAGTEALISCERATSLRDAMTLFLLDENFSRNNAEVKYP